MIVQDSVNYNHQDGIDLHSEAVAVSHSTYAVDNWNGSKRNEHLDILRKVDSGGRRRQCKVLSLFLCVRAPHQHHHVCRKLHLTQQNVHRQYCQEKEIEQKTRSWRSLWCFRILFSGLNCVLKPK